MKYIKKENNSVVQAPSKISRDGYIIHGYNNQTNEVMLLEDGYIKYTGSLPLVCLDIVDGEIIETSIAPTMLDYDNAMEQKLTEVRYDRGYTVREPSAYINSSNARWAQDALDWIAYVDEIMAYGLGVQNSYVTTGEVPTLYEFIAGLAEITWSYEEV